jgi:hypothetical protein
MFEIISRVYMVSLNSNLAGLDSRNPSLGLAIKAKGLQGCESRRSLGINAKGL